MNDLISREGMVDTLNKFRIEKIQEGKDVSLVWECIDKVLQEPSVESEIAKEISKDCNEVMEGVVRVAKALAEILESKEWKRWLTTSMSSEQSR